MRRFRFTIASLLVVVLFLAVGFAALRESSDLWDSGLLSLTIGVLLISILLAVHRTDKRRGFWLGFATFGWIYLGLSLVPSIESRLMTTKVFAYLDSKVPGRATMYTFIKRVTGSGTGNMRVSNVAFTLSRTQSLTAGQGLVRLWNRTTGNRLGGWSGTTENFVRIGHSLFTLLVGWLGAQLSRRLCRTSRFPEPNTAVDVEGTNS